MTVSRALSNHPNVQQEKRDAILKRAQELGYVRNAAAKAMRGDGSMIVGLLLPNIVNEFYARFANAMAMACEKKSYHLVIHLTNDDIEVERQSIQRLREVQAMAVVMVPAPGSPSDSATVVQNMNVIQLIRQRPMDVPNASMLIEDSAALGEAVAHLAKQGHRNIAFIGGDSSLSSGRERLAAFKNGLEKASLKELPELIHTANPSFSMGTECAGRVFEMNKATAIVCGGFEISNGILNAFMRAGIKIDRDIAFIGYGDPSFYAWINGGISTIRVPVDQPAIEAVDLFDKLDMEINKPLYFDAELVLR